jgi:predicted nucleotidyltransferase
MGTRQIQKPLKRFLARVKARYQPQAVILYGSYARNEAHPASDIDVIVVAASFARLDEEQRFSELYDLTRDLQPDFHVYGFTPAEARRASPLNTLSEALRTGVLVG